MREMQTAAHCTSATTISSARDGAPRREARAASRRARGVYAGLLALASCAVACSSREGRDASVEETGGDDGGGGGLDLGIVMPPTDGSRAETASGESGLAGEGGTLDGGMIGPRDGAIDVPPVMTDTGIFPLTDVAVPPGMLPPPGPCRIVGETALLASDPMARPRAVYAFGNARGVSISVATERMGAQNVWLARLTTEGSITSIFPVIEATGAIRGGAIFDTGRESTALLFSADSRLLFALADYSGRPIMDSQRPVAPTANAGDQVRIGPYGTEGLQGFIAAWRETVSGRGVLRTARISIETGSPTVAAAQDLSGDDDVADLDVGVYTDGMRYRTAIAYVTAGATAQVTLRWIGADGAPGATARLGMGNGARGVACALGGDGATVVWGEAGNGPLHAARVPNDGTSTSRDVSLTAATNDGTNVGAALDGTTTVVGFRAPLGSNRGIALARLDAMLAVREVSFVATAGDAGRVALARQGTNRFALGWADVVGSTTTARAGLVQCE